LLTMGVPSASDSDVDALFKLPLGEFTAARNALVAKLKRAGRQAEANEVKALAKPSVPAWVVNQLYWRHRESFDRMIEAGDRLRRAQASRIASTSGREPTVARREAVTALTAIAAEILREGNHGAARELLRRVTSTLEALSSYGSLPDAPAVGRLTNHLEPAGFEAVADLFSGSGKPAVERQPRAASTRAEPTRRREEKDQKNSTTAAKASVRDAERAMNTARKEVERAAARSDAAAKRAKALDAERAQIEERLAQVAKDADAAHHDAQQAAAAATKAREVAEAAERNVEFARRRLQEVTGSQE
jgi:hypothetical protein